MWLNIKADISDMTEAYLEIRTKIRDGGNTP